MMLNVFTSQKQFAAASFGVMTLLFAAAGQMQAKTIDYTPDVTSDAYWDTHDIGVVRVTGVGKDEQNREYIIYQLETQFSGRPLEQARTLIVSHVWFGSDAEGPPVISLNDRFVLYMAKDGEAPIAAVKIDIASGSQMLDTLAQVARLRANPGDRQGYMEGVFAGDPVLSRYCLRRLLEQAAQPAPDNYLARLRQLRNEGQPPGRETGRET